MELGSRRTDFDDGAVFHCTYSLTTKDDLSKLE